MPFPYLVAMQTYPFSKLCISTEIRLLKKKSVRLNEL